MDSKLILTLAAAAAILAAPEASAWQILNITNHDGKTSTVNIADDLRLSVDATTIGVSGNGYDLTFPVAEIKSISPYDDATGSTVQTVDAADYTLTAAGILFPEATDVTVTDMTGRTVMNRPESNAVSFGTLPAGVYIISAKSGKVSFKVIVK